VVGKQKGGGEKIADRSPRVAPAAVSGGVRPIKEKRVKQYGLRKSQGTDRERGEEDIWGGQEYLEEKG